jgi:hypothetical protein
VEIATKGIAGLPEKPAPVLRVGIRPERGDELVATKAALARGSEERQQP